LAALILVEDGGGSTEDGVEFFRRNAEEVVVDKDRKNSATRQKRQEIAIFISDDSGTISYE
jgi:hypothetical protein